MALERELTVIALTDHDTLGGVAEALATACGTGLELIPGVEINSMGGLHILGYYVDAENGPLRKRLQAMREARMGRAHRMVERLHEQGMELELEEILSSTGGESVGRPHLARALLDRGYVETLQEAFDRFVGPDGSAYVPRPRLTPAEAIQVIREAGGVPVMGHPAHVETARIAPPCFRENTGLRKLCSRLGFFPRKLARVPRTLPCLRAIEDCVVPSRACRGVLHSGPPAVERIRELVDCGLCGLEVYYPSHSPEEIDLLLELCREFGLLATGGTDFHGPDSREGAPLGSVYVPPACAERLREAAGG